MLNEKGVSLIIAYSLIDTAVHVELKGNKFDVGIAVSSGNKFRGK
jgi:hypothetical protein